LLIDGAGLAIVLTATALVFTAPAAGTAEKTPEFTVVSRDGRRYTSATEPAIKRGFLFLTDGNLNFFSLPLETVDWPATQAANRGASGELLLRWEEGPVRYLLESIDVREYRALTDDARRAAWISAFWDRLDPTPETFFNERRFEYWSRLEAVNRLFTESTRPGWMTDRGKIYLLLGPPDEIESFPNRSGNDARFDPRYAADAPAGYPRHTIPPRGVTRWTYRNTPGGLDPNMIVAFREDPSGEYRLSNEAIDYDRVFRDTSARMLSLDGASRPGLGVGGSGSSAGERKAGMDRLGRPAASALSLMGDLGRLQDLAPVKDWLREVVSAREYFGAFPLTSAYHFYRSREGQTYLEVNLEIEAPPAAAGGAEAGGRPQGGPPAPPFSLSARLISQADPEQVVEFSAGDGFAALPAPEGENRWLYQSGVGVEPGAYTLLVAITLGATGQIGSWRELVDVPNLSSEALILSDLVLASRVEPLPTRAATAVKEPFLHGRLRVVPDVDQEFRAGSELSFYYQIYGASADPAGRPELDLLYRFERREADGWRPFGVPVRLESEHESSQAFTTSLAGWPSGPYRLSVEVADRRSGQRSSRTSEFTLRAP
jgi:GWxTD domain-containing protein